MINTEIKNSIEELATKIVDTIDNSEYSVEPSLIFDGYKIGKTMAEEPANEVYILNLGELGADTFRNWSFYGNYEWNTVYGEINSLIVEHFLDLNLFDFDWFEMDLVDENVKDFFEGIDYLIKVLTIKLNDYVPFKKAIEEKSNDPERHFELKELKAIAKELINFERRDASELHEFFLPKDDDIYPEWMDIKRFFLESGLVYMENDIYDDEGEWKPLILTPWVAINDIDEKLEDGSVTPYEAHWAKNFLKWINE